MTTGLVVTLDDVDVTCHAFAPLSVVWGREHPGDSLEPRRATLAFDDVAKPRRGQTMVATLHDPAAAGARWVDQVGHWSAAVGTWNSKRADVVVFRGRITDTAAQWQTVHVDGEADERWGAVFDVTAVDPIAELANQPIGDAPWPQETISNRATRIEALTPLTWVNDPSAALVAARDVDLQPAADLLDDLAHMASLSGGLFYDPNTSTARFLLDSQRNSLNPTITLDACSIADSASDVVDAGDVVNDVTVSYVNPADLNAQPTARYVQTGSVQTFGRRTRSISTQLVTPADAATRAQAEAVRYGVVSDKWVAVRLGTAFGSESAATGRALLVAGPSVRVRLTTLPAPAAATHDGYVEGWSLVVDADEWTIDLNLSPAPWTGPLMHWADVTATQRWVDVVRPWAWQDALALMPATLQSPSFEVPWTPQAFGNGPEFPNGYPTGWGVFWILGPRGIVRKGAGMSGPTSLEWQGIAGQSSTQRLTSNAFPVAPGATIQVGMWAQSAVAASPVTLQLDVMTAPHSNPAPFAPNTRNQTAMAATAVAGAWTFYSGTVVVPAGHTFASFSPVLSQPSPGGRVGRLDLAQAN
jgi:hypothetical protein